MIIDSSGLNPSLALKIDTNSTNNDRKTIKKVRKNA